MTRRPACASASAARRIGIKSRCQSRGAMICAISGAPSVAVPARINVCRIEVSRQRLGGESSADMVHAMTYRRLRCNHRIFTSAIARRAQAWQHTVSPEGPSHGVDARDRQQELLILVDAAMAGLESLRDRLR